jgi:hypothetical protein
MVCPGLLEAGFAMIRRDADQPLIQSTREKILSPLEQRCLPSV